MGQSAPAVVFVADENYALPLAAAMYSVLTNLRGTEGLDVYVLHPGLSSRTKDRLQEVAAGAKTAKGEKTTASLSFIEVDSHKHLGDLDLKHYDRFTEAIYYRLLIGELLPKRHDKVLYLDCDVIVEDNVLDLWSIDTEGQVLLAVQQRTVSCPQLGVKRWKELGLDADEPYFNSGVLMIDMEKWREGNVGRQVLDYLHRHRDSLNEFSDQEGFNAVLAGQWKRLPQKWNVLRWYYDPALFAENSHGPVPKKSNLPELTENPSLIHFTHFPKPWEPGCPHPARGRFYHYLRQSGWFSYPDYVQWRLRLSAESGVKWLKESSRPIRHKLGLRRANLPSWV